VTKTPPDEKDSKISDIFYYFEEYTTVSSGRTAGRKIGVVQEVILRDYLQESTTLRRSLYLERKLVGASGAGHKVEFSWFAYRSHRLSVGDSVPSTDDLTVSAISPSSQQIFVRKRGSSSKGTSIDVGSALTGSLTQALEDDTDLRLFSVSEDTCVVDVVDFTDLRASLESKRVGAQRFKGSKKLGAGIQTIEKAKQASLVALDLDLAANGTIKPLQSNAEQKKLLSFVALGNGVHWTKKDRAVLSTYVDFTYLVTDAVILRYAEYVRDKWKSAGSQKGYMEFFSDYFVGMTKQGHDDFEIRDEDFEIIVPTNEPRAFKAVLEEHLSQLND